MIPDIAMTTCKRVPEYVGDSLASMFSSDPLAEQARLRIVVDGDDASFLGKHQEFAELMTDEDSAHLKGKPVTHRIFFATTRALAGADVTRPLILLQDDVCFQQDWLARAAQIHEAVSERHGGNFICALWGTYRRGGAMYGSYTVYPPQCFYGNVALLISTPLVGVLADHFKERSASPHRPDDMEVKKFLLTDPFHPLFLALPNLVEHRGDVSTRA